MKILVCDDLEGRCKEVVAMINEARQEGVEVASLAGSDLTKQLESLFEKVEACVKDPTNYKAALDLSFDAADIVIIDNNLAHLGIKGTRLTAESIAGYIRAFSSAPYIVSLNKNPDVDFDLRHLVGDYATRTDLALNTKHLANPALWTGIHVGAQEGFLPWYWPSLSQMAARRREQIGAVRTNLANAVLATFDFAPQAVDALSRHAKGFLSPTAQSAPENGGIASPIDKVSFQELFKTSSRSLPDKSERDALAEAAKGGNVDIVELVARVVAAEIDVWFRRDVVGPQEVLVDVPHLLMRMPFLLGDRVKDESAWKEAVRAQAPPYGLNQTIFDEFLAGTRFVHDIWVRWPCFWWPKLKATEKLNELYSASETPWPNLVFCEDTSAFEKQDTSDQKGPKEFVAEFEGAWGRRYVKQLEDFKYAPRSRLAL